MAAFENTGKPSDLRKRGNRLSVHIHKNQNLKIGLQNHLMKNAGLNESDF
jgi:hypothetical protein